MLRKWLNRMRLPLLLPAPILLFLTGCELVSIGRGAQPIPPTSDFCTLFVPVSYDSTKDTPETVAQIEPLNAKWLALCDDADVSP